MFPGVWDSWTEQDGSIKDVLRAAGRHAGLPESNAHIVHLDYRRQAFNDRRLAEALCAEEQHVCGDVLHNGGQSSCQEELAEVAWTVLVR